MLRLPEGKLKCNGIFVLSRLANECVMHFLNEEHTLDISRMNICMFFLCIHMHNFLSVFNSCYYVYVVMFHSYLYVFVLALQLRFRGGNGQPVMDNEKGLGSLCICRVCCMNCLV